MGAGWDGSRAPGASTQDPPLRVGVLGTGRIGRLHAELLAREVPGARLVVVADVDEVSAKACAARLGVDAAVTVEEVLSSPHVDAVAVCTSTDTHVALSIAAAQAGKAIFCEKPVSLDLPAMDTALAAVDAAGVPFMVGFNRRFDLAHQSVRDAVRSGRLGELSLVRITSRDPAPPPVSYLRASGGMFLDMTIHDFDMARYVVGREVVEVYAKGAVRVDREIGAAGDVDTAVVLLTHEDGTLTTIDNSRRAVYGYDQRLEAFGSGGMAQSLNPPAHSGTFLGPDGLAGPALGTFFLERYLDAYRREWAAFAAYVRGGGPAPVSGADGRAPVAIGLAAWRSVREGRPVRMAD